MIPYEKLNTMQDNHSLPVVAARVFAARADAPAALDQIEPLTPGDIALVARKARVLGDRDPNALAAMLAGEVAAKPGAKARRIGF